MDAGMTKLALFSQPSCIRYRHLRLQLPFLELLLRRIFFGLLTQQEVPGHNNYCIKYTERKITNF